MPLAFQDPYRHFTFLALAFLVISFYFFFRKAASTYRQLRLKWNPPAPYDPRLLRYEMNAAIFRSLFVLIGVALLLAALYLTRYQFVGDKTSPGGVATFGKGEVAYSNMAGDEWKVKVQGHQAAAGGIILRFPTWLRFAGIGNYFRIVTFRGFDENEYHYMPPPEDWLQQYADSMFLFIYKNRNWLKMPEALYVESPYFNPGKRRIFATHSGFIID